MKGVGSIWITNKNKTSSVIDNSSSYKSGHFGKYLEPGESYYFSVTAYYSDKKVAGNAVKLKYPQKSTQNLGEAGDSVTSLTGKTNGENIILNWSPVKSSKGFNYYKLVVSKYNPKPAYPYEVIFIA